MGDVDPICRASSRHPDRERALALMEEAPGLLERLVECGEVEDGSPPDATRWYLEDATGMLSLDDEEVSHV